MGSDQPPHETGEGKGDPIEQELHGRLPCVVCSYDLRGLSIVADCPECGTAVRATILSVVDPHAKELIPIQRPAYVGWSLVVWAGAALVACVLGWMPLALALLFGTAVHPAGLPELVAVLLLVSGAGSVALVRPHEGLSWFAQLRSIAAVLAVIPLAAIALRILKLNELGVYQGALSSWPVNPSMSRDRIILAVLVVVHVVLIRPSARLLVMRSLVLRTGRVDRQTLLALAGAAVLAILGDIGAITLRNLDDVAGTLARVFINTLILAGSALFSFGLIGCLIDSWRICVAVRRPSPTLHQLTSDETEPNSSGGEIVG